MKINLYADYDALNYINNKPVKEPLDNQYLMSTNIVYNILESIINSDNKLSDVLTFIGSGYTDLADNEELMEKIKSFLYVNYDITLEYNLNKLQIPFVVHTSNSIEINYANKNQLNIAYHIEDLKNKNMREYFDSRDIPVENVSYIYKLLWKGLYK